MTRLAIIVLFVTPAWAELFSIVRMSWPQEFLKNGRWQEASFEQKRYTVKFDENMTVSGLGPTPWNAKLGFQRKPRRSIPHYSVSAPDVFLVQDPSLLVLPNIGDGWIKLDKPDTNVMYHEPVRSSSSPQEWARYDPYPDHHRANVCDASLGGETFLNVRQNFSDDTRTEGKVDIGQIFSNYDKTGKSHQVNLDNLVFDDCDLSETQYFCIFSGPTNQSSGFLRLDRVTLAVESGVDIPMFGGKEEPMKIQIKGKCRKGKQQL